MEDAERMKALEEELERFEVTSVCYLLTLHQTSLISVLALVYENKIDHEAHHQFYLFVFCGLPLSDLVVRATPTNNFSPRP